MSEVDRLGRNKQETLKELQYYAESRNDEYKYAELATQEDFDKF